MPSHFISSKEIASLVSLMRDASQKAQMVHNEVEQIETDEIISDEIVVILILLLIY